MIVRKRVYPSGRVAWELDRGIVQVGGKKMRVRSFFESPKEAKAELKRLEDEQRAKGREAFTLSTEDRVRYQAAERRLREVGLTLEGAVELALKHWNPKVSAGSLQDLWLAFKADRLKRGRDPVWVDKLGVAVRSFIAGRELWAPGDVSQKVVDEWVHGNGWSPKTQRNYLGALSSMFRWAKLENPCAGVELSMEEEIEPAVLSVEDCERLLVAALNGLGERWDFRERKYVPDFIYRPLLGYVAIGMFGGIRPEEMKRSPRAAVHLDEGVMVVTAARAKPGRSRTRRRRVVELPANAIAWLRIWDELCPGTWIVPKGFRHDWIALRKAAGCWPWPHDALRHTAATMDYALNQNEARLKAKFGHSDDEDTLFQHYRAVTLADGKPVTKAMAERFLGIVPPGVAVI